MNRNFQPRAATAAHRLAPADDFWSPWIPEREDQVLSEEIDFHKIFKVYPTAMALLTADFTFIDANDAFLAAIGRSLEDLVGRNAFEVAPKMPEDADGCQKWTALEAALTTKQREVYQLQRYDIEDPAHPGVFAERYWSSIVTPVLGQGGEVEVLELSAREVTPIISQFRSLQAEADAASPTPQRPPPSGQVPRPRRPEPLAPAPREAASHKT
jgi:PAS domain S-box-containing protein